MSADSPVTPDTPREEQVRMDEKAVTVAYNEVLNALGAIPPNPSSDAFPRLIEIAISAYLSALPPSRPAEPTLLQERYWCGCLREARWTRCERHTTLDHDEEPKTRAQEERSAPLPSGEPTGEAVAEKCHYCKREAVLVKERKTMQWGGAREGERPFFHEADAEYWRCEGCGEEWYTAKQSARLDSQLLHAITREWRKLADATPLPPSDAPEKPQEAVAWRSRITCLDEVIAIVEREYRGYESDVERIKDAALALRDAALRSAAFAHPVSPALVGDGPFGAETALCWLVERCSHPHDVETQAMAAVVRASLARVPTAPRLAEVEKLLNRLRAAIDPKDDDYAEPLIQKLLALLGPTGGAANARASETSENIARNYVPQGERTPCGDALMVLGFRDRVALVEAGRAMRDDFGTDVLRALCGEAAQCTAEVDNDAARELTVRLNQAWRGEDPCGIPAHGAGETKP